MEKRIRMSLLFDLYGGLITDKRSQALRLSLEEDLSLSEIAEIMGVSRQAVHDGILRAETKLEEYEKTLGMLAKRDRRAAGLQEALKALEGVKPAKGVESLERAKALIREALEDE